MYYLFNKKDNSYNCHSYTPFTEAQKDGAVEVYYEGNIPEGDITMMFFDFENHRIVAPRNLIVVTPEQIAEWEAKEAEYEAQLEVAAQNDMLNAILEKLKPALTEEQLALVGSFDTTSSEDQSAIEDALDGTTDS